jgi:hypothetical protein
MSPEMIPDQSVSPIRTYQTFIDLDHLPVVHAQQIPSFWQIVFAEYDTSKHDGQIFHVHLILLTVSCNAGEVLQYCLEGSLMDKWEPAHLRSQENKII